MEQDKFAERRAPGKAEAPLKLYWWNAKPNFGDAINPDIVSHVSGRDVVFGNPATCDLTAIGSVLGFDGIRNRISDHDKPAPYIWGSGVLKLRPVLNHAPEFGDRIRAVRGPMTALRLPAFDGPFGDPGLLTPMVQPAAGPRSGIGIVPHHQQWDDPQLTAALQSPGFRLIDVRLEDPWEVVRQIASCEAVISTSLHGLIVADAYGVPNVWLEGIGAFKFFDYFYGVGRAERRACSLADALKRVEAGRAVAADSGIVADVQQSLIAAFPDELRSREVAARPATVPAGEGAT